MFVITAMNSYSEGRFTSIFDYLSRFAMRQKSAKLLIEESLNCQPTYSVTVDPQNETRIILKKRRLN